MSTYIRCNECKKDCGSRAKLEVNGFTHLCSYRCAKLYYERQEIVHEEKDRAVKDAYWASQKEAA